MHQSTLTAAALALTTVLTSHRISHAFFGGWAIIAKGAERESKDLDCLVKAEKDVVVRLLTQEVHNLAGEVVGVFMEIPQARNDYVAFFWKASAASSDMVLVELFTGSKSKFPPVVEHRLTSFVSVPIIDNLSLFRGKLSACAFRSKPTDCSDVVFLATNFAENLRKDGVKKIDSKVVGMAVSRYPELADILEPLGVSARKAVKKVSSNEKLSFSIAGFSIGARMNEGEVQRGLFI